MPAKNNEPVIDWEPAPGHLICVPMKREELAALYNRSGTLALSLPDKMGKVSDSVGVGRVVVCGQARTGFYKGEQVSAPDWLGEPIAVGSYIAFMPYVDKLIEIDGKKYSIVRYDQVMAVRKGDNDA